MTAPAVLALLPDDERPSLAQTLAGVSLDFLDTPHAIYAKNKAAWEREERRLAGGDAVLAELTQFDGESAASFEARKKKATYVPFPKVHANTVTGRLRMHAPTPGKGLSYGTLGEVRTRDKIDTPTFAELVHYNVDGTGNDGSEMPVFFDGVDVRAQATGHRWLFWEAPPRMESGAVSLADVQAGFRPYVVEWSPLDVPNWYIRNGELQFAVVRVATAEPFADGKATDTTTPGYYLLVRAGYTGFGAAFSGGGWWLFDADKQPLDAGTWARTKGRIPMWVHYGDTGTGTTEWPAMSQSSTMELGQIAVSLMDTISARDYDAWDAAASRLYFLGADASVMNVVTSQLAQRSMTVAVPPAPSTTGDTKTEHIVSIYDSSAGAVASTVFSTIIEGKFTEAAQQSFIQATSIPSSSGVSKEIGDQIAKSPMLARRAAMRQASENTFLYFAELRFGFAAPTGFSQWPTDFELRPLLDDLDAAIDRLRRSALRSSTLAVDLLMRSLKEDGLVTDENEEVIKSELTASAKDAAALEAMDRDLLGGVVPVIPRTEAEPEPTVASPDAAPVVAPVAAEGAPPPVTEPLNGAQITAAKDVMLSLRAAMPELRLAPEAVTELLVLVGVPRPAAEAMVAAQGVAIDVAPDVEEEGVGADAEDGTGEDAVAGPVRALGQARLTEDDEQTADLKRKITNIANRGVMQRGVRTIPPAPSPDLAALSAKLDTLTAAVAALAARPVEPPAPPPAPSRETLVVQLPPSTGARAGAQFTVTRGADGKIDGGMITPEPETE